MSAKHLLISAAFTAAVVAVIFRVPVVRKAVTGQ